MALNALVDSFLSQSEKNAGLQGLKRLKVWTFAIALLTRVRLRNSSALQSPKWQLIGMS